MVAFFDQFHAVFEEIQKSTKIRVLPSGTFSRTPAYPSSNVLSAAINLARERWTSSRKVDAQSVINWTVNSALHPPGVAKSSTSFGWG